MDRLPYDLKVGIFAMLPLRDRVRCTGVSREWRELVMDEWDTFEVRKTRLSLNAPSMFKQELGQWVLNHIPPHQIRRFEVRGDEEDYHQAIQVLQQGQFSRLEFLLLSKSIFSPAEETAVFPLCIIQACHAHLTELHLGSVSLQNDAGSWLSSVLSISTPPSISPVFCPDALVSSLFVCGPPHSRKHPTTLKPFSLISHHGVQN
ncbi:hypothetical protein BCR43DRAFT_65423 [Syncephalastrum racemosum]|uniref:F-box domain-containing protein n=1 Tax=Syncephalastrum racemosum TaxID=13706 RepID=A0A1X2HWD3_SYNRA|nr:hypothetical protein BCR43DRAFT_65423 [Syncephalastrum racemosum]